MIAGAKGRRFRVTTAARVPYCGPRLIREDATSMPDHVCTQQPCAVCLIDGHHPIPSYMLAEHRRRLAALTPDQLALVERVIAHLLGLEPLPATAADTITTAAAERLIVVDRVALPHGGAVLFVQPPSPARPRPARTRGGP